MAVTAPGPPAARASARNWPTSCTTGPIQELAAATLDRRGDAEDAEQGSRRAGSCRRAGRPGGIHVRLHTHGLLIARASSSPGGHSHRETLLHVLASVQSA